MSHRGHRKLSHLDGTQKFLFESWLLSKIDQRIFWKNEVDGAHELSDLRRPTVNVQSGFVAADGQGHLGPILDMRKIKGGLVQFGILANMVEDHQVGTVFQVGSEAKPWRHAAWDIDR